MNPAEQEALFLKVRERFPDFTARWASGYVHGVVDEGEMAMPAKARALVAAASRRLAVKPIL